MGLFDLFKKKKIMALNEDSLDKLLQRNDIDGANALLRRMLEDITEPDDGRFARKPA